MKILYFGSLCDRDRFNNNEGKRGNPFKVAQFNFEEALISGFLELNDIDLKMYYLHQENYYPKGSYLKFKSQTQKISKQQVVNYLAHINLPILKEITFLFWGLLLTIMWAIKNRKEKQKVILTPFNYTPLSLGIYITSKVLGIKRVNIFTDLSSHILNAKRQKDLPRFKKYLLPLYMKVVNFIEGSYDGYILFTEPMNDRVNPNDKPYILLEGIYNNNLDLKKVEKTKAIMHAGTLNSEYGVKNILDAFEKIDDIELELWIFGDGDLKEYIEKLCLKDSRVKYFGFKSREEVFEYEKRATLLINTRDPNDEYTMYSFPSKTFEYMVSGTPFLTTNLLCIPEEYKVHLFLLNDIKNLNGEIINIINKPQKELILFGEGARKFVLNNKNSFKQAERTIMLLKRLITNKY